MKSGYYGALTVNTLESIEIQVNGAARLIARQRTIADLLQDLNVGNRRVAVELDGRIVPRSLHGETEISAGAIVEIITAVGGG